MNMYNLNENNSKDESDILIRQMKIRISELEEQSRNYQNILDENYQLKELLNKLNSEKSKNENEFQKNISILNTKINDLISENENLKNQLNEKIVSNKKLYYDNEIELDLCVYQHN